jgi:hypothetical protein
MPRRCHPRRWCQGCPWWTRDLTLGGVIDAKRDGEREWEVKAVTSSWRSRVLVPVTLAAVKAGSE